MKTTATAMRPFEDPDLDALIQMVEAHLREDVELTIGPWSRSEAMLRIEMPAARDDSPQVAFYEKLGFEELGRDSKRHQIKMGKELEGVG